MMRFGRAVRRIGALLLLCTLLSAAGAPALAASDRPVPTNQKLSVDGVVRTCEVYNINDSNYFKLRDIACLLNGTGSQFSVGWDPTTRTVTVTTGAAYTPIQGDLVMRTLTETQLRAARESPQTVLINGAANSSLRAWLIGDYNFFNLRDLGKALGFDVDYDTQSRTMLVTSRPKQTSGQPASTARLGLTADAGRDYLDKIVFLGDSTTYAIGVYYNYGYTALCPPEQIWAAKDGWIGLHQINPGQKYSKKIVYPATGEELFVKDAAAKAQPEILLITLGIDSIALLTKDQFIAYYTTLISDVRAASPNTKIILNSIYPVADSYKYQKDINNDKINAANGWIEDLAVSSGCRFLYSWEALAVDGKLPEMSQNGDGLHLNGEAFTKVMQYIRTHAYL